MRSMGKPRSGGCGSRTHNDAMCEVVHEGIVCVKDKREEEEMPEQR